MPRRGQRRSPWVSKRGPRSNGGFPESLLERQILRLHPRPRIGNTMGRSPALCIVACPPGECTHPRSLAQQEQS